MSDETVPTAKTTHTHGYSILQIKATGRITEEPSQRNSSPSPANTPNNILLPMHIGSAQKRLVEPPTDLEHEDVSAHQTPAKLKVRIKHTSDQYLNQKRKVKIQNSRQTKVQEKEIQMQNEALVRTLSSIQKRRPFY